MHVDPIIPPLVGIVTIVLALGLLFQLFRQPQLVAYIVAGILLGPQGIGIIEDPKLIEHLGALGVTLLLFFIGMEVSPSHLIRGWRIATFGTLLQIIISVATIWFIGQSLDWSLSRIILLGFVISLSSTAVVLKLLKDRNELNTKAGQNVLLILLAQDLAVVPMLIIVSLFSSETPDNILILKQVLGGLFIIGFAAWIIRSTHIKLPFSKTIKRDHEVQLFAALLICFGFAFITGILGLSAALGAFVAGLFIAQAKETDWVHHALEPMRIIFVALLFVSMGMLIDISFVQKNMFLLMALLLGVLITNTFINAIILKLLGDTWGNSIYSGALLSQIGEFSFVLASVGFQIGLINDFSYQATIALIALSLLISPMWIQMSKALLSPHLKDNTENT
ncbi:MAG: cation:proton antiporter [Gammaproteobacteria bacterium]|nr:cation:proton antiporter [Gammaproteobacteria bacterium]